jgi:hypothetical protein
VAADPRFAEAHAQAAECLYSLKRYQEAIPYYDTVIQLEPQNAGAYNGCGLAKSYSQDMARSRLSRKKQRTHRQSDRADAGARSFSLHVARGGFFTWGSCRCTLDSLGVRGGADQTKDMLRLSAPPSNRAGLRCPGRSRWAVSASSGGRFFAGTLPGG